MERTDYKNIAFYCKALLVLRWLKVTKTISKLTQNSKFKLNFCSDCESLCNKCAEIRNRDLT